MLITLAVWCSLAVLALLFFVAAGRAAKVEDRRRAALPRSSRSAYRGRQVA